MEDGELCCFRGYTSTCFLVVDIEVLQECEKDCACRDKCAMSHTHTTTQTKLTLSELTAGKLQTLTSASHKTDFDPPLPPACF